MLPDERIRLVAAPDADLEQLILFVALTCTRVTTAFLASRLDLVAFTPFFDGLGQDRPGACAAADVAAALDHAVRDDVVGDVTLYLWTVPRATGWADRSGGNARKGERAQRPAANRRGRGWTSVADTLALLSIDKDTVPDPANGIVDLIVKVSRHRIRTGRRGRHDRLGWALDWAGIRGEAEGIATANGIKGWAVPHR